MLERDDSQGPCSVWFSFAKAQIENSDPSRLRLVYINQQNVPIVQPLTYIEDGSDNTTFKGSLLAGNNVVSGLIIATVTGSERPFADTDAVAKATILGPAFIEID